MRRLGAAARAAFSSPVDWITHSALLTPGAQKVTCGLERGDASGLSLDASGAFHGGTRLRAVRGRARYQPPARLPSCRFALRHCPLLAVSLHLSCCARRWRRAWYRLPPRAPAVKSRAFLILRRHAVRCMVPAYPLACRQVVRISTSHCDTRPGSR